MWVSCPLADPSFLPSFPNYLSQRSEAGHGSFPPPVKEREPDGLRASHPSPISIQQRPNPDKPRFRNSLEMFCSVHPSPPHQSLVPLPPTGLANSAVPPGLELTRAPPPADDLRVSRRSGELPGRGRRWRRRAGRRCRRS